MVMIAKYMYQISLTSPKSHDNEFGKYVVPSMLRLHDSVADRVGHDMASTRAVNCMGLYIATSVFLI